MDIIVGQIMQVSPCTFAKRKAGGKVSPTMTWTWIAIGLTVTTLEDMN
jgi:hypothetical protein